jgi:hypothetical protein
MKAYLDSTDTYYSINQEAKTKPSKKNNDEKIGIGVTGCLI